MDTASTQTMGFRTRAEAGRTARSRARRTSHSEWAPAEDRPDPISLLEEQAESRLRELVPIRYARMSVSPFTFYRGAASIMAADLAGSPDSEITVQLCGDAHLSNFGLFASPERVLIFDINDFDETLPGPWEWDVKRLVASVEVAGRHRGFSRTERQAMTRSAARGYRERMREAATASVLTAWYDRLDADAVAAWVRRERDARRTDKKLLKRTESALAKARTRDSLNAFAKLVEVVDGELRIVSDPPLVVPLAELTPPGRAREENERTMRELLFSYQSTLLQQNHPMREFEFVDMARKVVGVGSVGTRAWILLLRGRDDSDPLILQAKEAQASVLERYLPASEYENHGERVVRGQRLMQAASDIFLGWQRVEDFEGIWHDFYLRQLHDWKGAADVETMPFTAMTMYARVCGETLARAHARSGDRVAIAGYLGKSDVFDRSIARFAERYADQNERDYAVFQQAIASGRLGVEADG
jgi:uncharacterized protein (DUF2252 family)